VPPSPTPSLPRKVKSLQVGTPQGHAGVLARESRFQWRYEAEGQECAIALGLPTAANALASSTLHPVFAMNLPEGEQRHRLRQRVAGQFAKFNELAQLALTGHEAIGRLRLSEAGGSPAKRPALFSLAQIKSSAADLFEQMLDLYGEAGISGAQPKVMVPDSGSDLAMAAGGGSDLIIKTGGVEHPYLSQNEFLCMTAARLAGLEVPEFHLSDDGQFFIVRRFDLRAMRQVDGSLRVQQLGFEDMAVLLGALYDEKGNYKYQGHYEALASKVGELCVADASGQKAKWFEQLALSVMVRNGDAHLKNFGLLYDDPSKKETVRLCPLFDVVTTSCYDYESARTGRMLTDRSLALKMNKSRSYPSRAELLAFGRESCAVENPGQVLERIAQAMGESLAAHRALFTAEFGRRMADEWEAGRASVLPSGRVFGLGLA
jgi:serine/threonine-protein kinase HipA